MIIFLSIKSTGYGPSGCFRGPYKESCPLLLRVASIPGMNLIAIIMKGSGFVKSLKPVNCTRGKRKLQEGEIFY